MLHILHLRHLYLHVLVKIFSISADVKEHARCILPVLPSPITAIFVKDKDGKLEQKFFEKEDISDLEQDEINRYYTVLGNGDSGAGVIMNGGVMGGHEDTRSTILAVATAGLGFGSWVKRRLRSPRCVNQVSRLAHKELEWMKVMDRKHFDGGKNANIKYLLCS